MHTRSLRLAFLSSLGLIPLGCAGQARVGDDLRLHGSDASAEPGPDGRDPHDVHPTTREDAGPSQPQPRPRDGGSSQLASCEQSTAVPSEDLLRGGTPRSALAESVVTGIEQCSNGVQHRPAPVTCSLGLPRPMPPGADGDAGSESAISQVRYLYEGMSFQTDAAVIGGCESDADCTAQPYGYCAPYYEGNTPEPDRAHCNYGCVQDSDCAAGFLCRCDDPVGACVPADCRSDADCAGDSLCAAWFREAGCSAEQVFTCQTPADECNTSDDCDNSRCSVVDGTRQCTPFGPVCGRPFLVEGSARLAELRAGSDWIDGITPCEPRAPSAAECALAAEFWARSALMEHASIAAFARFTLQLMHLGAPRELIERSQQAMLDETAHAKACFALASRYLSSPVEPGPLAMRAALDEHELAAIVVLTFREGCVGETVAALEAREALDGARDVEARAALERIAADEQSHAELAWRFVRWALGKSASVRPLIEREAARLEAELAGPDRAASEAATVAVPEHGVLSERRRAQLRRAALAEVVLPCARGLLESQPARAHAALA